MTQSFKRSALVIHELRTRLGNDGGDGKLEVPGKGKVERDHLRPHQLVRVIQGHPGKFNEFVL